MSDGMNVEKRGKDFGVRIGWSTKLKTNNRMGVIPALRRAEYGARRHDVVRALLH